MIAVLMFVIMCALAVGIAGMQYLLLVEQRRTQQQLARVDAAVERFERRQFLSRPIIQTEEAFSMADVFDTAWHNYERHAA